MKKILLPLALSLCAFSAAFGAGNAIHITLKDKGSWRHPFTLRISCNLRDIDTAQTPNLQTRVLLNIAKDNELLAQAIESNKLPAEILEQLLQLWFYCNWNRISAVLPCEEEREAQVGNETSIPRVADDLMPNGNTITHETHSYTTTETCYKSIGTGANRDSVPYTVQVTNYSTRVKIVDKHGALIYTIRHTSCFNPSFAIFADGTIWISGTYYRPGVATALRNITTSAELARVVRNPESITLLQRSRCSMM